MTEPLLDKSDAELTPWFPADMPPVRKGVYQVAVSGACVEGWYSYWNGGKFGWRTCSTPLEAFLDRELHTALPHLVEWRGLARKP